MPSHADKQPSLLRFSAGIRWVSVALCAWLAACAGSADHRSTEEVEGNVEIFSWWTSRGEQEALKGLIELYRTKYPKATVTNAAVEYAEKARDQLTTRMAQGLPPDTFQANAGADLFNWVLTNTNDASESKVENLQGLAEANGWLDVFDTDVLEAASYGGKLRGVPVNVHRINSLIIRKDLFEKHGLAAPKSLTELYELCERISHDPAIQAEAPNGDEMACLGLGNKHAWTLSLMVFEMILPSITSASYYEEFWRGERSGKDPELREALEAALYLYCGGTDTSDCPESGYFNEDVDDIAWDEGVSKVAEKRAMMAAMGDWAKGYLESEGLKAGSHFDIVPFPGSEDTFVFTSDTFPLPKGAPNWRGAIALLETFASREGQVIFNTVKGSIPARLDIDHSEFDSMTWATMHDFRKATKVLALSGLLPRDAMPYLAAELKASMQFGSIEIIENYLKANYDSIK